MLENKVVAYYRTGGKYDTPLDSLDVQQRRVAAWAKKNDYEVVGSFHDSEGFHQVEDAYDAAGKVNGFVIVASACRIAKSPEAFLSYTEEVSIPLLTTESIVNTGTRTEGVAKAMTLVETIMLSHQEYYYGMCEEWLN